MSRPLRIQYPDAWYHVMNRGRRGEAIFPEPEDCQRFMELLQEGSTMWNVRIAAFCLMPKREQRGYSHEAKDRKRQELEAESAGDRASPQMS